MIDRRKNILLAGAETNKKIQSSTSHKNNGSLSSYRKKSLNILYLKEILFLSFRNLFDCNL